MATAYSIWRRVYLSINKSYSITKYNLFILTTVP